MVSFAYLYRGLCGLARAHRANNMAGHLGAAVAAGYFYGEEHPDLDPRVVAAVEKDLDRIIAGDEPIWFDPAKTGITIEQLFEPFPEEAAQPQRIGSIAEALGPNIDRLRESGHNVIFASIALRALHDHPQHARPSIVDGIVRLIQRFDQAGPGRAYYGQEQGWFVGGNPAVPLGELPGYQDLPSMAVAVVDELIASAAIHRRGFGGLFHVINHATALTELARFGYTELAERGLAAHRHHLQLWQSLPDLTAELGELKFSERDPRDPEYWGQTGSVQWSAHLTHRIKTLYAFFSLLRLIENPAKRKAAEEQFLYLMA